MRCLFCKQYVPDGLGLKNCPNCNADLTNIEPPAAPSVSEVRKPLVHESKSPPVPQTPGQKRNFTTKFLFDFKYQRGFWGAMGFGFTYFLIAMSVAGFVGIVEFKFFHHHVPLLFGLSFGPLFGLVELVTLAVLILKKKRRLTSLIDVALALLGVILCLKSAFFFGFFLVALLLMRPTQIVMGTTNLRTPRRSNKFWILILIGILILSSPMFFFRSGRSYYIDSDQTVGTGIPDNRIDQYGGKFFRLTVLYPEDMYKLVLGMEVFLKKAGATHFLQLAVTRKDRDGLPVRFRIKSLELKEGNKKLPFLFFQDDLYKDQMRLLSGGWVPLQLSHAKKALAKSTEMLLNLDFSETYSAQELYFGYFLSKPPKRLSLDFEIEVYQLGGEPKQIIKKSIELKRLKIHGLLVLI